MGCPYVYGDEVEKTFSLMCMMYMARDTWLSHESIDMVLPRDNTSTDSYR